MRQGRTSRRLAVAVVAGAAVAVAVAVSGVAMASTSGTAATAPKAVSWYACQGTGHRAVAPLTTPSAKCAAGTTPVVSGAQGPAGPKGATGATGKTGATGAQGPGGVTSAVTKDLGAVASVPTGGGFVAGATEVGTVDLAAGTYMVSVAAKATPLLTSDVQVFPQFFVYDQAVTAAFSGDLFNVGSGALESGGHVTIDSYYSGSGVVTLAGATTLRVYAFGYDSDTGAGSYALDDLTVTAVQLQAGS